MAFATHTDVSNRLEASAFTGTAQTNVTQLCDEATAVICDAVGKKEADITNAQTLKVLKGLCIKAVIRARANPSGAVSESETLGDHSRTTRHSGASGGVMLTAEEGRQARDAMYGELSGSSTPRALPDRLIDLAEGRDVDEIEVP